MRLTRNKELVELGGGLLQAGKLGAEFNKKQENQKKKRKNSSKTIAV